MAPSFMSVLGTCLPLGTFTLSVDCHGLGGGNSCRRSSTHQEGGVEAPLVWGRWRSGWLGSATGAQMEPLPGNTAESHLPVFPHAVGAQSNTPTCVLPLVGLGLTVGNE